MLFRPHFKSSIYLVNVRISITNIALFWWKCFLCNGYSFTALQHWDVVTRFAGCVHTSHPKKIQSWNKKLSFQELSK